MSYSIEQQIHRRPIAAVAGFLGMLICSSLISGTSQGFALIFSLVLFNIPFIGLYLYGEDVITCPGFAAVPAVGLIGPALFGAEPKGMGLMLSGGVMLITMIGVRAYYVSKFE